MFKSLNSDETFLQSDEIIVCNALEPSKCDEIFSVNINVGK